MAAAKSYFAFKDKENAHERKTCQLGANGCEGSSECPRLSCPVTHSVRQSGAGTNKFRSAHARVDGSLASTTPQCLITDVLSTDRDLKVQSSAD